MHALAKASDLASRREVFTLLEEAKTLGVAPNVIMYNEVGNIVRGEGLGIEGLGGREGGREGKAG